MMRLILSFLLVSGFKTCLCDDPPAGSTDPPADSTDPPADSTDPPDWCYVSGQGTEKCKDPSEWCLVNGTCGGAKQSPINIVTSGIEKLPKLTELKFTGYDVPQTMTMKNDKKTVSLVIPPGASKATLTWAQIPYKYRPVRIDFHWSNDDKDETKLGSEHTIDGTRYKMEMQVLHVKDTYTKIEDAQDDPTGVAILAILIEAGTDDNPGYTGLVTALADVVEPATEQPVTITLNKLILPVDMKNYYYYEGSVTKPGCQPAIWIVLKDRIKLKQDTQIEKFYNVKYDNTNTLVKTYRPVQPLRGRKVYDGGIPSSGAATLGVSFTFILMCLIAALGCFQLV